MTELFSILGVTVSEQSLLYREFTSLKDLRDTFINYCPSTFSYDDVSGNNDADLNDVVDDIGDSDGGNDGGGNDNNESMLEHIRVFASGMLEDDDESGIVNKSEGNLVVVEDGEGTLVGNFNT